MSYRNEEIRVIACDLCGRVIGLSDRRFNYPKALDYVSVQIESEAMHVCEDCVEKIFAERFQISNRLAGGIKDGAMRKEAS